MFLCVVCQTHRLHMKPYFTGRSILLGLFFSITGVFAYGTDTPGISDADKPAPRTTGKPYQRPLPARALPVNPSNALPDKILPLPMRPTRPYPIPWKPIDLAALDPIRFTLKSNLDTIRVGEEVTLTVQAEMLNLPPTMVYTFDESYSFRLRIILPEGFEQTGGDFVQDVTGQLNRWQPGQTVTFTLKGYFWQTIQKPCFKLLRGSLASSTLDRYVLKAEKCLALSKHAEASSQSRQAALQACTLTASQVLAIGEKTIGSTNVTVYVKGNDSYLYGFNQNQVSASNQLTSSTNQTHVWVITQGDPSCAVRVPISYTNFASMSASPVSNLETALQLCLSTSFNTVVNVSSSQLGPHYGCLGTQPNPQWYFFKTSSSGRLNLKIQSACDVDFICWGPFNTVTEAKNALNLTSAKTGTPGWCNFSTASLEYLDIQAEGQKFYILLLTNFGNCSANVTIDKIFHADAPQAGVDCSPPNCNTPGKPTISASGPTLFCQGQNVTLNVIGNFSSYEWSNGATSSSITVNQGGSYQVRVKGFNDCGVSDWSEWSDPNNITVNPLPATPAKPSISASLGMPMCQGQQVILTAPGGFNTYQWSTGETSQSITVSNPGLYNVRVRNDNECGQVWSEYSDNFSVSHKYPPGVPAKPGVSLEGNATFCQGQATALWAPENQAAYEWRRNGTVVSTERRLQVNQAGLYTVRVKTQNDCGQSDWSPESDGFSITVNNRPPTPGQPGIEILGQTTFCQGGSVIFNAPENQAAYEWRRNGTVIHTGRTFTTGEAGQYTVRVRTQNDCGLSDWSPESGSSTVTVNARPSAPAKPGVTLEGNATFCQGQGAALWAPDNQAAYEWRHNGTVVSTERRLQVSQGGLYTVRVKTQNDCGQSDWSPESDGFPITVNDRPAAPGAPNVDVLGSTNLCQGQSVILNAPENQAAYEWLRNGIAVATNRTLTVTEAGLYTVRVKIENGCGQSDWSPQSATTSVSVTPYPTVSATSNSPASQVRVGETLNLTATATGATSYSWSGPNGFTSTQQNPSLTNVTLAASGSYTITAFTNGCTATSTTEVTVGVADSPCGQVITKIRFMPRLDCPECMSRFTGGYFEASNDSIQWQRLADITAQPAPDWNEYTVTSPTAWRYVRYVASANSYGEAAGIEFWNGTTKLTGRIFASGSLGPAYVPNYAFDDLTNTFWHGTDPRTPVPQNFIGLNIQKNIITAVGSNSPASQVKVGETLNLTVTAVAGASFSWSGPNGFTSTQQNPSIASVSAAAAGTYSVTATAAQGCTATATTTVQLATCTLNFSGLPQLTCDSLQRQGKVRVITSGSRNGYKVQYRLQRLQLEGGNYVPDSTGGWVEVDTFPKLRAARYRFFIREVSLTAPTDTLCAKDTTLDISCGKQRRARAHASACGIPYQADLSNQVLLQRLMPGDTLFTSDYDVIVTQVLGGGNGSFEAYGYIQVPILGGVNVLAKLHNAVFNNDYDLVSGYVESTYDPTERNVLNAKAIASDAVALVRDVVGALTDLATVKITDSAKQIDKIAKQFRDIAAKEMPKQLIEEVETAIKEMKAAQKAYENATTPAQKEAAQQAFDAAKAKVAAAKQKQEEFLDQYEDIIKLALTAIKNEATSNKTPDTNNLNAATSALQLSGTPPTAPFFDNPSKVGEAPLNKQSWIPSTDVQKITDYYGKEIKYNQTFLNLYFSQALDSGGPGLKKLAKELRKDAKALGQFIYDETHKSPAATQEQLVTLVKQSIITHLENLLKIQVYRNR